MIHPSMLVVTFVAWVVVCSSLGVVFAQHASSVSLSLFGAVAGAVIGFLVGNSDGPAEVPAYAATGASLGLFTGGFLGLLVTVARPPSRPLRRAALAVLIASPFAAVALTFLLQTACPLYVTGKKAGVCAYQQDVLGGWVSGVIVAFVADALFLALLLMVSARQARRLESEIALAAQGS